MFGNGKMPYFLMNEEGEFLLLVSGSEPKFVEGISNATELKDEDYIPESPKTTIVDAAYFESCVKVYTMTIECLLERNKEDLKALKMEDRMFTNNVVDEIIALEQRIPKIKEIIAERKAAAKLKYEEENPEYVIFVGGNVSLEGYVHKISEDEIEFTTVPKRAKIFDKEEIDIARKIVEYQYGDYVDIINIYHRRSLEGIKEHQRRRDMK